MSLLTAFHPAPSGSGRPEKWARSRCGRPDSAESPGEERRLPINRPAVPDGHEGEGEESDGKPREEDKKPANVSNRTGLGLPTCKAGGPPAGVGRDDAERRGSLDLVGDQGRRCSTPTTGCLRRSGLV